MRPERNDFILAGKAEAQPCLEAAYRSFEAGKLDEAGHIVISLIQLGGLSREVGNNLLHLMQYGELRLPILHQVVSPKGGFIASLGGK